MLELTTKINWTRTFSIPRFKKFLLFWNSEEVQAFKGSTAIENVFSHFYQNSHRTRILHPGKIPVSFASTWIGKVATQLLHFIYYTMIECKCFYISASSDFLVTHKSRWCLGGTVLLRRRWNTATLEPAVKSKRKPSHNCAFCIAGVCAFFQHTSTVPEFCSIAEMFNSLIYSREISEEELQTVISEIDIVINDKVYFLYISH